MADIITINRLSEWLDDEDLLDSARAGLIVQLTNAEINEAWESPIHPAPAWVLKLALTVASRAWLSKPGRGPIESLTRSFDDSSKTERYAVRETDRSGSDVFLTDEERDRLASRPSAPVGSIRLGVPQTWPSWS
jgi:hypothetical protein